MKQTVFMALAATTLFFTSCSKKTTNDVQPQTTNTVTIGGAAYATVKIGTQTWTAVNYNGSGGVNYNASSTNDPASGKLYTNAEAEAVTLPTGWRLPTSADYTKLYASQNSDATKLMAKTSWTVNNGTNTSGFNALAVGYFEDYGYNGTPAYQDKGIDAVFLTSSMLVDNPNIPACFDFYQDGAITKATIGDFIVSVSDKASLRFVKDN